jgi:hypothetical protein
MIWVVITACEIATLHAISHRMELVSKMIEGWIRLMEYRIEHFREHNGGVNGPGLKYTSSGSLFLFQYRE